MSFSNRILIGLALGVAAGLFLGERAAAVKWAADGFVKLLQMTVLPYVTVSIVSSLGRLDYREAQRLGAKAGLVLAGLWGLSLVFTFLIPLTFPAVDNASFFSTSLVEQRPPFNFVDLYIPSNPFHSLANNIVPAVVLFSVLLGVALIGVERKGLLLDVLGIAGQALAAATRMIVRLTPYGLFAIAATTAGTISLEQLGRLQVYLVTYVLVALLVSLWVLPGLVAALTPIRVGDIFALTRNALLTAFVAGDLFIVLPVLIDASKTLLDRAAPIDPQTSSLPDVIVPASFNFPHAGKLLSISFILFAGWFSDAGVRVGEYPRLAFTGLVSFFGSLNVAVPFLLDLFRIPADTFQLFLASGVVNSRFGTLVAAMHTVTVALLGACAVAGSLQFHRRRILRYLTITVALTIVVIGGGRALFAGLLDHGYTKDRVLGGMHLLRSPEGLIVRQGTLDGATTAAASSVLDAVRSRRTLKVGYTPDALPYAFVNAAGQVVGFDIELAHHLAAELSVDLELVALPQGRFETELSAGRVDVVMSGVVVTTARAGRMVLTAAYLDETLAVVVPDATRDRFSTWTAINEMAAPTLAVPDVPYYVEMVRRLVPDATILPITDIESTLRALPPHVTGLVFPAERGSAWTLLHPAYSVVVPGPGIVKIPLAYPVARGDQAFAAFLSTWIDLKRKDGTLDAVYRYWILGRDPSARSPRWSVVRNVLHWVE
jgi:Na+/H+-dicarboxylate symporter/ABC-type amino acid transport substrate-binding protein